MKKALSILVSISFLAVLAAPALVSAIDNCMNWQCQGPVVNVPCMCGAGTQIADGTYYCWGAGNNGSGRAFSSGTACEAARVGGSSSGASGGYEIAPEAITGPQGLLDLIEKIGNWIFSILLGIAGIMLIMAGFFWITAGGNPENVKKASDMLRNALIGVAVAVGAKGLVLLIKNIIVG